ncbi:MAG: hypothetical protein ACK559_15995, partial [bacterium]
MSGCFRRAVRAIADIPWAASGYGRAPGPRSRRLETGAARIPKGGDGRYLRAATRQSAGGLRTAMSLNSTH